MKKTLSALLATSLLTASVPAFAANGVIDVYVNHVPVVFDTNPEIVNDRTFVPLRAIAEALGSQVEWNGETQSITLTRYDVSNYLQIGSTSVRTHGNNVEEVTTLEAAPYIKDDRTMVPIRFISEGFGMQVEWDGETQSVYITYEANSTGDGVVCYDGFRYVPDFGKYFSIEADESSSVNQYFYSGVSASQQEQYINLLLSLGFVQVDELITDIIVSYGYQKGDEQIVVAAPGESIGDNGKFAVTPIKARTGYKGELKFYEDHPAVPDYGAINNVEPIYTEKLASNITQFVYPRSEDASEAVNDLTSYQQVLNANGFETGSMYLTVMTYYNEESYNSVILQQGDDTITVLVEDVPEEFR